MVSVRWLVVVALLPTFGQRVLLTAPPQTVEVFGQKPALAVVPAPASSHRQILLVHMDLLTPDDLASLKPLIRRWYAGKKDKSLLTLVTCSGSTCTPAPPLRNAAALEKELRDTLRKPPDEAQGEIEPIALYGSLAQALPAPTEESWQSMVWVGRWPALPKTLQVYAGAWLSRLTGTLRVRLAAWSPDGVTPPHLETVARRSALPPNEQDLNVLLAAADSADALTEASWTAPALKAGCHLTSAILKDANGLLLETPEFAQAPDFTLPSPETWARIRESVAAATELAKADKVPPAVLETLKAALAANPGDVEALSVAADAATKLEDFQAAVPFHEALLQFESQSGARWKALGFAQYRRGPLREAEVALRKARELAPGDALVAERLGRIRLEQQDPEGAIAFFDESLQASPNNVTLWWIRADIARDLKDTKREAESLTRALSLEPGRLDRRTRLVALLLERGDRDAARPFADAVWDKIPPEVPVLTDYARFWETLGEPAKALTLWQACTKVDPSHEPAYFEQTRLLSAAGKLPDALQAAESGLAQAPKSARLHLRRGTLLQELNRLYDSRRAIAEPALALDDVPLARRYAEIEDLYGNRAVPAWRRYVTQLQAAKAPEAEIQAAARRGHLVAIRDNETEAIPWFESRAGYPKPKDTRTFQIIETVVPTPPTMIPGGLAALSFMVRNNRTPSPNSFLRDYARIIARTYEERREEEVKLFQDEMIEYFAKLQRLEQFGKKDGNRTLLTISFATKPARQSSERILDFLGLKLRREKDKFKIEAGEKKSQAKKQDMLSALAVNELEIEEALNAAKPVVIEIVREPVPVLLGETQWLKAFAAKGVPPGGLVELMVRDPRIAKLYSGLSLTTPKAAEALLYGQGLGALSQRFADLVYLYGWALAADDQGAIVPGGDSARAHWTALAGTSPDKAGSFYNALLTRDEGILLAYFADLSELDPLHQRFFTRSSERLKRFYELFKQSTDMKLGALRRSREAPFLEFLRDIPLNDDLTVNFPGSPEVWMVAKGQGGVEKTAKMMRKVAKTTAPAIEDDILSHVANRSYKVFNMEISQLANFLAVAHIDQKRREPLTETEALLLSQHYVEFANTYPYFTTLTELKEPEFVAFFRAGTRLKDISDVDAQAALSHFHPIAALLCLLVEADALTEVQGSRLFAELIAKMEKATTAADWSLVSSTMIRQIVQTRPTVTPQQFFEDAFCPLDRPTQIAAKAGALNVNSGATCRADFRKVLQLQKVPSLDQVVAFIEATESIGREPAKAGAIAASLEKEFAAFPLLEIPKEMKVRGETREVLEFYAPKELPKRLLEVRQKAARKKPNPRDFEKLSREILSDVSPLSSLATLGLVYAHYLRPADLLVSDDPWLLRKHQFVALDYTVKEHTRFPAPEFAPSSEGTGSYAKGSLAGFAEVAGEIAVAGKHKIPGGELIAAMQIASSRSAHLDHLRELDMRIFKLKVLTAREWIAASIFSAEPRSQLATETLGLLSPTRRFGLLSGIEQKDWESIWKSVTLADLYRLGELFVARHPKSDPWPSPVAAELRRRLTDDSGHRLDSVGRLLTNQNGEFSPTLRPISPYEDFERYLLPRRIAERVSEFNLYLASLADDHLIPPSALPAISEPLLQRALGNLKVTNSKDWTSALDAWSSLRFEWIEDNRP